MRPKRELIAFHSGQDPNDLDLSVVQKSLLKCLDAYKNEVHMPCKVGGSGTKLELGSI